MRLPISRLLSLLLAFAATALVLVVVFGARDHLRPLGHMPSPLELQQPEAPRVSPPPSLDSSSSATAPTPSKSQLPTRGTTTIERETGAQITNRVPTWPPLDAAGSLLRESLSEDLLSRIESSSVPVLLPSSLALASESRISLDPNGFSAFIVTDGIALEVYSSSLSFRFPGDPPLLPPSDSVRGIPAAVGRGENYLFATWAEFNVSYKITVSCESDQDQRCSDDRFLRDTADTLTFVGGRP